jgi:dihydroorotase-like cyclic amidohydrolase
VVVFDPKTEFTITQKKLPMNVDYTPYEGMNVTRMPMPGLPPGRKGC